MAAPLSLSRATITTPGETFTKVSLLIRQNAVTVRRNGATVAQATLAVDGVHQQSMTRWELALDDGTVWQVERNRGCGCGGR